MSFGWPKSRDGRVPFLVSSSTPIPCLHPHVRLGGSATHNPRTATSLTTYGDHRPLLALGPNTVKTSGLPVAVWKIRPSCLEWSSASLSSVARGGPGRTRVQSAAPGGPVTAPRPDALRASDSGTSGVPVRRSPGARWHHAGPSLYRARFGRHAVAGTLFRSKAQTNEGDLIHKEASETVTTVAEMLH
jgi:hypothetical protein